MNMLTIAVSALKERSRSFAFWGMAGLALAAAFLFVPSADLTGMNVLALEPATYIQ